LCQDRVLKAQALGDDRFFQRLANSFRKGTNSDLKKIKKTKIMLREKIVSALLNEDVRPIGDLNNSKNLRKLKDNLYKEFFEDRKLLAKTKIGDKIVNKDLSYQINQIDEALNILIDEDYFYKWMYRHILEKDTKKSS